MTEPRLRFGLIGTGRIGQIHAGNIAASPDATLSWIADPIESGASAVALKYGGKVTTSAEELIGSGEVDAVVIASPTPTHVELIRACVAVGLPVFCEKPIDLDIARVDALRALVAASGVPVALGFNRRFDPAFASVRDRVAAGEVGELEQLLITSRDPAPPPVEYIGVSGGIFRDMSIHDFDMARFFLPQIVEVTSVASTLFDEGAKAYGDYDTAITTLRASSGAVVTITNSRHSAVGYDQRLEAFGAKGSLMVSNAQSSLVSVSNATGVETKQPYQHFFLERYARAYALEIQAFIASLRGNGDSLPTFEDGRAALILADAASRSAAQGVTVPVDLTA